jgi:hypothetical protein
MASLTEEIADALALDVIKVAQELGDDELVTEIGRIIGATSTTTQEAFMTAVRVRMSEQRARQALAERMAKGPARGTRKTPGRGRTHDLSGNGG